MKSPKMRRYKAFLKHDNGAAILWVWAASKERAIDQVMTTEKCPRRAITEISAERNTLRAQ